MIFQRSWASVRQLVYDVANPIHELAVAMSRRSPHCRLLLSSVLAVLLGACGQQPNTAAVDATAPPAHRHAHAQVYRVDPQRSTIALRVYRDGPLARFGHNHAIAITGLAGIVYREKNPLESDFELSFPVARMSIDRPEDRAAAGAEFSGELSEFAIAGTRENMLGPKLLAADQYPEIRLQSVALLGSPADLRITVKVTVRGIESQMVIPAKAELGEREMVVSGKLTLSQTQLGLTPFSVLGGGLRVRDTIDAEYRLVAVRE